MQQHVLRGSNCAVQDDPASAAVGYGKVKAVGDKQVTSFEVSPTAVRGRFEACEALHCCDDVFSLEMKRSSPWPRSQLIRPEVTKETELLRLLWKTTAKENVQSCTDVALKYGESQIQRKSVCLISTFMNQTLFDTSCEFIQGKKLMQILM